MQGRQQKAVVVAVGTFDSWNEEMVFEKKVVNKSIFLSRLKKSIMHENKGGNVLSCRRPVQSSPAAAAVQWTGKILITGIQDSSAKADIEMNRGRQT